jgi:putative N6-adenine-specific DNA methylase
MSTARRATTAPVTIADAALGRDGDHEHVDTGEMEIFLVAAPGHEAALCDEAAAAGFHDARIVEGGVAITGGWPEVWRANLVLRGTGRVLARFAVFRALHLAQLDKRARRVPWAEVLRPDVPVRVEATCRASRIYHSGAAAQRVARAIADELGAPITADAEVAVRVRLDDDLCTLSLDTSGTPLHKRGHKMEVAKAPLRETLAAMFLRTCGYDGREPVLDPMCGSGTFVIEAAEIAAGLAPGRSRRFAFEALATFDADVWQQMRAAAAPADTAATLATAVPRCHGRDIDAGAVRMARANAERAGVAALTAFEARGVDEIVRPDGPPGLVMVNPPYGDRIGDRTGDPGRLTALYRTLGATLIARFTGWRVGLVTSEPALARATGLPFAAPGAPVSHGGLRVHLHRTGPLR